MAYGLFEDRDFEGGLRKVIESDGRLRNLAASPDISDFEFGDFYDDCGGIITEKRNKR